MSGKGTRLAQVWVYAGFLATGVSLAMPGAILPALLKVWHLDDRRAGAVLFCLAFGGACGALLVRGSLPRMIAGASFSLGVTGVLWAWIPAYPELPALLWGLGLGAMMTSISLLRKQQDPRASQLIRLNFLWAVGALMAPLLVSHALRANRPRGVLLCFGAFFLLYAVGALFALRMDTFRRPNSTSQLGDLMSGLRGVPLPLIVGTILAPGIEAACSGWLATYADRYQSNLVITISTPSSFWAGLLMSRVLAFLPRGDGYLEKSIRVLPVLVVVATASLIFPVHPWLLMVSAFVVGFGLGPLYPALLSEVLDIKQTGAIFFLAGIASSVLPWMTGQVSASTRSLRTAMLIPVFGALTMLAAVGMSRTAFAKRKSES
jgi:MFS transporter, FHS family, glucose/mannose:H+ symporter